ncbi:unnamed protein product [Didymodactylos carnosus]|uniref:Uncharacterized protein n=2 Tax=Didymodactylos carnosus TaxID=1234261 RepID=A0A8S2G350_9BILA|nr:unnamed protein product [Didymodactylos carnosus]CAF4428799.1 unnamed protein product [Didymodactylos carnosus]
MQSTANAENNGTTVYVTINGDQGPIFDGSVTIRPDATQTCPTVTNALEAASNLVDSMSLITAISSPRSAAHLTIMINTGGSPLMVEV